MKYATIDFNKSDFHRRIYNECFLNISNESWLPCDLGMYKIELLLSYFRRDIDAPDFLDIPVASFDDLLAMIDYWQEQYNFDDNARNNFVNFCGENCLDQITNWLKSHPISRNQKLNLLLD